LSGLPTYETLLEKGDTGKLSYDEPIPIAAVIESTINSQPLLYVTPDDLDEPHTPLHLLLGRQAPHCKLSGLSV